MNGSMTKKTIAIFWQHAWRYPWYVIGIIIHAPINLMIHQFLPPIIVAGILDDLSKGNYIPGDVLGSFGRPLVIYALLIFIGGTISWRLLIFLLWRLEGLVVRDLMRTQFEHLINLGAQFHTNKFGGSIVSQTNKLTGSYIRFADTTLYHTYSLIVSVIIVSVFAWSRSHEFVYLMIGVSFFITAVAIWLSRKTAQVVEAESAQQNKTTGMLADVITNIMAVKSFAANEAETDRFARQTEATRHATNRLVFTIMKNQMTLGVITSSLSVATLAIAAISVVVYGANVGTVFLLLNYSGQIAGKLWDFSHNAISNYNRAFGDSAEAVRTLLTEYDVKDPVSPEMPHITDGAITFKNVSFRHADSKSNKLLFKELNLDIAAGEKIGLVGHSGSGKTTLTKILLRYSDIDAGSIEIDGQNIAKITQADLRHNIAYVPQEPLLFHRTIAENIGYGTVTPDSKAIIRAAKQANAHEFIKELPQGYDTLVGERGVKLSGGQRQRVAIARALMKDSPILVLDEATSALDSESELLIQQALNNLMSGRTAIVIAHRLSTIQRMDRIVVMEHGAIIEQGSHAELLKAGGQYASLWAHQSGGFIEE